MPDRDKVEVYLSNGGAPYVFASGSLGSAVAHGIVRIEISREGRDQKIVFLTDPEDSRINFESSGRKRLLKIEARLAWLFNSERVYVYANLDLDSGELARLSLQGPRNAIQDLLEKPAKELLAAWTSGDDALTAYDALIDDDANREGFAEDLWKRLGGKLSFSRLPREGSGTRPEDRRRGIRVFLENRLAGAWTPVLESMAQVNQGSRLDVFGSGAEITGTQVVRLMQIPQAMIEGAVEPDPGSRHWFLAIMGLSHSWGGKVWNDLLGEQIRVSMLDIQHGALFAPLFVKDSNDGTNLSWTLVCQASEDLSSRKNPKASPKALWLSSRNSDETVRVRFPLLRNHLGSSIEADLPLLFTFLSEKKLGSRDLFAARLNPVLSSIKNSGIALRLRDEQGLTVPAALDSRKVRIGALDVTFATSNPEANRIANPRAELRWELLAPEDPVEKRYVWKAAHVQLSWAVEKVSAGGEDDLPGEVYVDDSDGGAELQSQRDERAIERLQRRERPLIISLTGNDQKNAGPPLRLAVSEQARQRDIRRVELHLHRPSAKDAGVPGQTTGGPAPPGVCAPGPTPGRDEIVVLDREPFLAAKVSFPALGSLPVAATDNEVATWFSYGADAGAWHVRFPDGEDFCLTLPPQGVGETMEKAHTLNDSEIADFRLSPPALLAMQERYYQQSFPEAPWNLRRLLSDPSRELPGAQLENLQYELLYGLSCRVEYPYMRLAELSALVGEVNGPLPQHPSWVPHKRKDGIDQEDSEAIDLYNAARRNWASTAQRTRQRLGMFELWDLRRLDTLELQDGVTCWIRRAPNDSTKPSDLVTVPLADLADPFDTSEPIDPATAPLKGGVTWGFESRNVYHAVVRSGPGNTWPQSNGAEIKDTRLSALGGYGHQMAAFDGWRSKIFADVAMGRTYSYTLERIGRIGVWWNRAKHVIIYQRTVLPSEQFAGKQNPLNGRAVLRKVEEYVEILQNVRKYPDQGHGDSRAAGFVSECSFSDDPNQVVRFHVISQWGMDIGDIGWKVPLWRQGETPTDLYPKPVVDLTVLASVNGESVPRKVTLADPDNLFFYTDTSVPAEALENTTIDLSNTDAWLPVEGVDFVDEASPKPASDNAFASGALRQASAGDAQLPVGFRPCTFLIEPAEHTVDLLANRRGQPMGAALSSVTLCRAKPADAPGSLAGVVATIRSSVAGEIQKHIDSLPADPARLDVDQIRNGLQNLCTSMSDAVGSALKEPAAQLQEGRSRLKKLGGTIEALVQMLDEQATEKIVAEAKRLTLYPELVVEASRAVKDDLRKHLHEEIERARSQVALMPSPAAYLSSVESALHGMEQQLTLSRNQLGDLLATAADSWLAADRLPDLIDRLRTSRAQLRAISQRLRGFADSGASLGSGDRNLALGIGPRFVAKTLNLAQVASAAEAVEAVLASAEKLAAGAEGYRELAKSRLAQLAQQATALDAEIKKLQDLLKTLRDRIAEAESCRNVEFQAFTQAILDAVEPAIDRFRAEEMVEKLQKEWTTAVNQQAHAVKTALNEEMKVIRTAAQGFFSGLDADFKDLIPDPKSLQAVASAQCEALRSRLESMLTELGNTLGLQGKLDEVRAFLERQRDETARRIEEELGGGVKVARQILGAVESKGDDVLKLVRAFGKPPEVSGLKFDRPEIAFFYDALSDRIDVTPVIARAAQAAAIVDALKPFGVDLPVRQLGEQLIPADLRNFDLSSILPDISGIPLKNLFSGLKMPAGVDNAVKVTHGVDPQTRRAWVNTDVDFKIASNATLFAVGPLAVSVDTPQFKAEARLEADLKGVQQRRVSGRLEGDWQLQIGGFPLITFLKTPLEFDEAGRVNFKVEPSHVQLAPALDFINQLMSSISPGGLTTRFDGDGVVSTLDLPIPDTQLGAFGFSGLSLGASLALRYGGGKFNIGVTASLARREAPFTLTIFVLGGAGYLELGSRYTPSTGVVAATADMAIAASASLAIALGPIRGGVAVYVGVTANYDSEKGGGLVVGLMFMVRGYVSVLSIASATITLRLDGQYQNGAMVGTGHLEISIKICWCFTLEVSESVTYTLGHASSAEKTTALGGPRPVAQIASLDGLPANFSNGGAAGPGSESQPEALTLTQAVVDYLNMLV